MANKIKTTIDVFARLKPVVVEKKRLNAQIHCLPDNSDQEILVITGKATADYYINHKPESYAFQFRKVFDESASQETVFRYAAEPVVQSALEGYNGTIFAYGQTGSGKTFTISGLSQESGIVPRMFSSVFDSIKQNSTENFQICMSYLEIYNEHGYDLLNRGNQWENIEKVVLLENEAGEIQLRNLSLHTVKTLDEAMALFSVGETNRMMQETPMNVTSSRSHCILTLYISVHTPNSPEMRHSKLHVIDLAGSERVEKSNLGGYVLSEACQINLSLHYLEQVIVALSEANRTHVPYRNSIMTSALRDSLGGNCVTVMIANLALEQDNVEETLSTCRFAQRVAMVKNQPKINTERNPQQEIEFLKAEINKLKNSLTIVSQEKENYITTSLNDEEINECKIFVSQFLCSSVCEENEMLYPTDPRKVKKCFLLLKQGISNKTTDHKTVLLESEMISIMSLVQDMIALETCRENNADINFDLGQTLTIEEKDKFSKYMNIKKKDSNFDEYQKLEIKTKLELIKNLKEICNIQNQILELNKNRKIENKLEATSVECGSSRYTKIEELLKTHSKKVSDYQAEKIKFENIQSKMKKIYQENYENFLDYTCEKPRNINENKTIEGSNLHFSKENVDGPKYTVPNYHQFLPSMCGNIDTALPDEDLSICFSDCDSEYSLSSTLSTAKYQTNINGKDKDLIASGSRNQSTKQVKEDQIAGYIGVKPVCNVSNFQDLHSFEKESFDHLTLKENQTHWNTFKLTGDKEVDEEIINFYKSKNVVLSHSLLI